MEEKKFDFGNLYAGISQVVRGGGILAKGFKVESGSVLGRLSNGELVPVDKAKQDASRNVYAIANDSYDATEAACHITVDLTGEFNIRQLKFIAGNTAADHEYSAREVGIFFKSTIAK